MASKPHSLMILGLLGCVAAVLSLPLKAQTMAPVGDLAPRDEDLPEVLVPRQPREEAVDDRLHATALFAEGRLLFRREQFDRALTRYERAYRYANGSLTILDEIVPLAFRLGRLEEAARYARRMTPESVVDPFVLRRLALYLSEQEEYDLALKLYGLATRAGEGEEEAAVPTVITQFEIGRLLYLSERFGEAATSFEGVQRSLEQADPPAAERPGIEALLSERPITYSLMAEAHLSAGRAAPAAELFRQAYQDQPESPILEFHLARVAAKLQDPQQALVHLRRYLESGNTDAGTAPYELLTELLQTGQDDKALGELEALVEQQRQNVFLVYYLGRRYLERREPERAVQQFQRLLEIRPLIDGYRGLLRARMMQNDAAAVLRLLADAVVQLGGLDALEEALDPLVSDPAWQSRLLETARRDVLAEQAAHPEAFQRAVALALGELLSRAEKPAAADEFYQRAAGTGDTADLPVWLAWGMQRLVSEPPQDAVEVFQGALELTADAQQRGPIYFYLSAALALEDRFEEALEAARQATRQVANVPAIELRPAWVLFLAKRWPEAADAYREFLRRYGDQYGAPSLRQTVREAKSSLSSICVFLDENEEAEEWLEQVLDEFPDDVGAHNDLGYLWADQGEHLQRALQMTRYATQQEPHNVAYRDSYGWALFRLGKYAEAVEQLRQATGVETPDGVILDHLGDALSKSGDLSAALDAWRRALDAIGETDPEKRTEVRRKIEQASDK